MRLTHALGLILAIMVGLGIGYYSGSAVSAHPLKEVSSSVVLVDSIGGYVDVSNVSRAVSLAPSITEIMFALGLEDHLVGVDDSSNYPERLSDLISSGRVRYVGSWWLPDPERVVALRPTLVLADGGVYRQVALRDKFKELGVNVMYLRGSSCRDVYDIVNDIKLIGFAFNVSGRAEKLASHIMDKVKNVSMGILTTSGSKPKVLFLAGLPSEGLYSAGGDTYVSYLIEASGGINIARDLSGWPLLSYEKIVGENPDVIIITMVGGSVEKVREELSKTPLNETNALRNGEVYLVEGEAGDVIVRPGPRVHVAVEVLSKMLHPEVFGAVNRSDVHKVFS